MRGQQETNLIALNSLSRAERILWLGAHKTGTTFLQGMLDATAGPLFELGVAYETLDSFREKFTRPLLFKNHSQAPAPADSWTRGSKRTILFDENIIGLVQGAVSRRFGLYPDMEARVNCVLDHLDFKPDHILFGIRNLAGYLPSLYCETLKSTPFQSFDSFMKQVPPQLQWYPTVKRLSLMFPNIPIIIYQAETLRGNERLLLSTLTGAAPEVFKVNEKKQRSGFSKMAIRKLLQLHDNDGVKRGDVHRITTEFPRSSRYPAFEPFGEVRRTRFERLYKKDLAEIIRDPDLTLLEFPTQ